MRGLRKFFVCALIILVVLLPLWPAFEESAAPMDEGSLLLYPELILKGEVPYRDFETFYGPANLWVLSAIYAGFSSDIFVERAVGLAYRILILGALFVITQRWSTELALGCTFIAGIFVVPASLAAYAWMGAVMSALWSTWMITRTDSKSRAFWGGVLAAIALLFRPDLGPAVIASALPLFLLMRLTERRFYIIGAFVALAPLAWLTVLAGPRQLLNNLLLFPVVYSNPGRHLPIFSADSYLIYLFFVHIAAAIANIVAGAISVYSNRKDAAARLLLGLGLFGLGLTHQAAQRLDLLHVVYAASASISLLPLSMFVFLNLKRDVSLSPRRDAILATAVILVLMEGLVPEFGFYFRCQVVAALRNQLPKAVFITEHGRSFPIAPPETALPLGKMFDRLDSLASPGERLFVGPADLRRTNRNDTFIYHMMPHLRPSTYFLEMNPGSANRPNSRLANDVASADWVVLDHESDVWNEQNASTKFGSDLPMRVVRGQFELSGRYGPWELYRKRRAASL
jgi:hypothetical protein